MASLLSRLRVDQINASDAVEIWVSWEFHTGVLDLNAELEVSHFACERRYAVSASLLS
jgi:hypothetical protein